MSADKCQDSAASERRHREDLKKLSGHLSLGAQAAPDTPKEAPNRSESGSTWAMPSIPRRAIWRTTVTRSTRG